MYQVGHIVNCGKHYKTFVANELNVAFNGLTATYGSYIIEAFGREIYIQCEHIHNIIEAKNFVNKVARAVLADDYDVDRHIRLIIPEIYYDDVDNTDDEYSDDDDNE
jgi:hypothetical protein